VRTQQLLECTLQKLATMGRAKTIRICASLCGFALRNFVGFFARGLPLTGNPGAVVY
jgi:hypothetical protein